MTEKGKFYLGDWIDNEPQNGHDSIIHCSSVDESKNVAIFDDGQRIPFMNLDLGDGRYEKVLPITECEEVMSNVAGVASSLGCKAAQSQILGDLSKIGKHEHPRVSEELRNPLNEQEQTIEQKVDLNLDPTGTFIASAIQISRKAGKKSIVPINLNLELDFDILYVIQAAMGLGASDVEILHHILRAININPEYIKKLIAAELLKSPEDAEIATDDREETFNETLNEELNKGIERYEDKEE